MAATFVPINVIPLNPQIYMFATFTKTFSESEKRAVWRK